MRFTLLDKLSPFLQLEKCRCLQERARSGHAGDDAPTQTGTQVRGAPRPPCSNLTCRRQQLVTGRQMVPGGCQGGPWNHSVGLFPRATAEGWLSPRGPCLPVGQIFRLDTTPFPEATACFPGVTWLCLVPILSTMVGSHHSCRGLSW